MKEHIKRDIWQNITVCRDCFRTKPYDLQHPANPCPSCGGRVIEKVGRKITTSYKVWYNPLSWFLPNVINWEIRK